MGRIIPFRKRPASRWAKPGAYHAPGRQAPTKRKGLRWFPVALVALPLAAFSAVLLLPLSDGPQEAAATGARWAVNDRTARSAADLDAEQPQVAAGFVVPGGGGLAPGSATDRERAFFALCSGPVRVTCVVDGDTIWYRGTKIRIADLDTPEVTKPACANEAAMGRKATRRLQALLNAGPFTLEPGPAGRTEDRFGRSLMLVTRDGRSLGGVLVEEGLAEQWGGPKRAWC